MVNRLTTLATVTAFISAVATPAIAQNHAAHPAHPAARHPARGRPAHGAPAPATPAPAATPPAEDPTQQEARREYGAGAAAMQAGNPAEALPHFQRALELRNNPVVLLPIAQAQEQTGHIADAIASLERYLHDRADAPDRAAIEQRLEALRHRPGTLHVDTNPPGGRIMVDARDTGQVTPADVPAEPGHHTVRVEHEGFAAHTQEVDVTAGGRADVTAELAANPAAVATQPPVEATPVPPPAAVAVTESSGPGVAVWAGAALAAGGIIGGSVFGFLALNDLSDYNAHPTQETRDRGETEALLSDICFGAAVLAASVAVVVYLSEGSAQSAPANGAPIVARHRTRFHWAPNGVIVNF